MREGKKIRDNMELNNKRSKIRDNMELNNKHRQALLNRFEKHRETLRIAKEIKAKEPRNLSEHWEVDIWLESEIIIPAIEKAIVNNELENF